MDGLGPQPGGNGANSSLIGEVSAVWHELVDFGHEPCGIHLGVWEQPKVHNVQFLARDRVIESVPLFIGSSREFDELRQFAMELSRGRA